LIDTGAQITVMGATLAARLSHLPQCGAVTIRGVRGRFDGEHHDSVPSFFAAITIEGVRVEVEVVPSSSDDPELLIGMDVLEHFDLHVHGRRRRFGITRAIED